MESLKDYKEQVEASEYFEGIQKILEKNFMPGRLRILADDVPFDSWADRLE